MRLAIALLLSLLATGHSGACDLLGPRLFEYFPISDIVFAGRVAGFRFNDTTLATTMPDCPIDAAWPGRDDCTAFWDRVVAVQFEVETPIKGITAPRRFEASVYNGDHCLALRIGQHWLTTGLPGYWPMRQLSAPLTPRDVAFWRWVAG